MVMGEGGATTTSVDPDAEIDNNPGPRGTTIPDGQHTGGLLGVAECRYKNTDESPVTLSATMKPIDE